MNTGHHRVAHILQINIALELEFRQLAIILINRTNVVYHKLEELIDLMVGVVQLKLIRRKVLVVHRIILIHIGQLVPVGVLVQFAKHPPGTGITVVVQRVVIGRRQDITRRNECLITFKLHPDAGIKVASLVPFGVDVAIQQFFAGLNPIHL